MEVISHVTQPVRAVVPGLRRLSARPRRRPRDTWFKLGLALACAWSDMGCGPGTWPGL